MSTAPKPADYRDVRLVAREHLRAYYAGDTELRDHLNLAIQVLYDASATLAAVAAIATRTRDDGAHRAAHLMLVRLDRAYEVLAGIRDQQDNR